MDDDKTVHFKAGEVIFSEGDPPGAVYVIARGQVDIMRGQGEERIHLAHRREGEVFGEMALVDNQPRSATATAATDCWCHVVSEAQFTQFIHDMPPVIAHIFRTMTQSIREMNETQSILAHILQLRGRIS